MTQEPVTDCFIVTTYEKEVDKLKLVEAASQFPRKFTESAANWMLL